MTMPMLAPPSEEIDPFLAIKATAPPATSKEVEGGYASTAEELMAQLQDLDVPEMSPEIKASITTLYGPEFPLLKEGPPEDEDWVKWVQNRWIDLSPTVQRRLWLIERNRLMRAGIQWVSSSGFGPWKEPPRPRDAARVVENLVAPALDQRLQILTEQRPGFRVRPTTNDQRDKARAEAKQIALEYQYDQQQMSSIIREAAFWAGTDGVSFLELYWDPDAGPWHEMMYDQSTGPSTGAETQQAGPPPRKEPVGDVKCRVRRIEQVRVSANATATRRPWFWIIKDVMSKQEAIRIYGPEVANTPEGADPTAAMINNYPQIRLGFQLPNIDELLLEQDKVYRYTVYVEKSLGLPKGLMLVTVGDKMVFQGPLPVGQAPIVRWPDGSTDPSFFASAEMEKWLDSQMRINAVKSKWVENVRMNAGVKLLAKENAISPETYTAANMSIISVKGLGGISDIAKPIEGFTIGQDAKELLALERKQFEDLTGWNDVSRGQFSSETSGRAIIAIREQLERVFSPMINAAALSMTDWARMTCGFMAWGYDYPRFLGMEGQGRPDLATAVMADDMDGVTDIFIDPETLMPMPRPLRLFLLKDMYEQGLLTPQEYRRRMPFAYIRDIGTPDEDQEARAKRVCEGLRQGQQLPILWQDNEAIHQDVLERELILPDDLPPELRMLAIQRWMLLANQSMMKQGITPVGTGAGPGGMEPPQGGNSMQLSPSEQPFAGTNPGIAAPQNGASDDQRAANQFDAQQRATDQGA